MCNDQAEALEIVGRLLWEEMKLRGVINRKWYARENDLIGGWCIVPFDHPPSIGIITIADFMDERTARHVVEIHNTWLIEDE